MGTNTSPRAFCCFSATLIYGSAGRATGVAGWLTSSSLTQSFTAYIGSGGHVCVCVARTVPVRQPGWYFSAGSAETWPSQHHGGVNQWNPIRHNERWERNWEAKKAQTETKSDPREFFILFLYFMKIPESKSNIFAVVKHTRAIFMFTSAYLKTICGNFKSIVWDMICASECGLCESHWCIILLHYNQIKLWYDQTWTDVGRHLK